MNKHEIDSVLKECDLYIDGVNTTMPMYVLTPEELYQFALKIAQKECNIILEKAESVRYDTEMLLSNPAQSKAAFSIILFIEDRKNVT